MFFLLFIPLTVLCGTIKQGLNVAPIWNSIANANVEAQYQFNFIPDTYIEAGTQLQVTFPSQYLYNLGTDIDRLQCSQPCSISGYQLTFTFQQDLQNGTTQSVSVFPITNPINRGGTGSFVLKIKRGENVIDENLIFGLIGIADEIEEMVYATVILDPSGSYYAGDYTTYIIYFKTITQIPVGSYIILNVPDQFYLEPFPACSSPSVNGKVIGGQLECSKMNGTNRIRVDGIHGMIEAEKEYALKFSMKNPIYAGLSDQFEMGIYKKGTQMMYEIKKQISGVTIQAALLQNVQMSPVYQNFVNSRSRIMDYIIKFTPTFPIPKGCNIKIVFPAYMKIMMNTYFGDAQGHQIHYVNYGLEDISENSPLGFFYLNEIENYLRITNFKEMTMPNEIGVTIRARNPDSDGYTTPLKIYVFQDITEYQLIMIDVQNAKTVVQNYQSGDQTNPFPDTSSLIVDNDEANENLIPTMDFTIKPTITVPKSGYIKIKVPQQFSISNTITNNDCTVQNLNDPTQPFLPSDDCYIEDNDVIVIKLTNIFALDILLFDTYYFKLLNSIYTPSRNGTFFFDITTYDTDGQRILDTYSNFLIIQPNPLSLFTVESIPNTENKNSILDIQFITVIEIPAAPFQQRATDLQGFFEFHFSNDWANDLGTGLNDLDEIACYGVNGLVPIDSQITCILKHSTLSSKSIVVVKGFKEIPPNTKVRILISGVTNPNSPTYTLEIKVAQKQNRIFQVLNKATASATLATSAVVETSCVEGSQYSEDRVGFLFDLTVQPCLVSNVQANNYMIVMLPKYDIGFIRVSNTITCQISDEDVYCIPLYGSDYILLIAPNMIISANPKIKIKNLQWPRYVETLGKLSIYIVDENNRNILQHLSHANNKSPRTSQFEEIVSVVPKKGKGYVDCTYKFTFYPQIQIPQGSIIILYFPSFYNLLQGAYFDTEELEDIDESNKISILINLILIKVSNFKQHDKQFTLIANGIKNSQDHDKSQGWKIEVIYKDKLVLQQNNFFEFYFTTPFKPAKIVFNQISASNLNADEQAIYNIAFTPQTDIPIGGTIEITFPSRNYKSLPRIPNCRVWGGISTFETCRLNGNTFIITVNSRYTVGNGLIYFQLLDVVNPDQGETDGFVIKTSYDNVYLDITDESTNKGRTFTTQKKTLPISVESITFDPKNEGEEAAYKFIFFTSNSLDITKQIILQFPIQYDPLLGRDIQCVVFSGLIGNSYKCYAKERGVYIYNFESYVPVSPIEVVIYGIVNPNQEIKSDWLKIYSRPLDSLIFDESNSRAIQLSYLAAPGWSPLYSIQLSTQAVRWKASYNFTFKTYEEIPKKTAKGSVLFDFPFEINDGTVPCNCKSEFAPILKCNFYRNRVTVQGNYQKYNGNLWIQLTKIKNPVNKGRSDFLYLRTYDGLNFKIIERNFNNLDPFQFDYYYPGPLIKIYNDDPIYIERGTQLKNIPLTVEEPCVLNLKLYPAQRPEFTIFPSKINIELGTTQHDISISMPQSIQDGQYIIEWQLDNELSPPLYTPVKNTEIYVTKLKSSMILQNKIMDIPLLGWSLETEYVLSTAPDINIEIDMNLLQQYKGIVLSKNRLIYNSGQRVNTFSLDYDSSKEGVQVERGFIQLVLSGINKDIYQLTNDRIEFSIVAQDTQPPTWRYVNVTNIQKCSIELVVQMNEPVMVYYLLALRGTVLPTLQEAQQQIINHASTQSQYGYIIVKDSEQRYISKISNLTSETDYAIHLLSLDRGENQGEIKTIYFRTVARPNSCDFTLKFKQKQLFDDQIRYTITSLAYIFGIPDTWIQQKKYYFNEKRVLQNQFTIIVDEVITTLDLQLAAHPSSESFPKPLEVIGQIMNKTQLIQSRLPDIDLSTDVGASEFVRYIPKFITRPQIVFIDYQFCAIKIQMDNYGWVFAIAVKFEQLDQIVSSPYQIMKGLDQQNRVTPFGKIEVSQKYKDYVVVIEGLKPETDYHIYLVGGSTHFNNPDLMESNEIFQDRIITFKAPPKEKLNIKSGIIISIALIMELIIFL